jgi:hypothetical protein
MESKIELHDRLRRQGQWNEAAVWKDAKIKELRAQGMKRPEAKEEAWRLTAEKYPPLPEPEPDEKPDEKPDEDQEEYDPEVGCLYTWLYKHFVTGLDWKPFLAKLLKITKEWSQFEEQWRRNQGVSFDHHDTHNLHQAVADFICYRLWPPPPSAISKDEFGSPETKDWLIGDGVRLVAQDIREWRDHRFAGERLDNDTMDELHRLVFALLLVVVDGRLRSPLKTVVNCYDGLFLTVEHRVEPPEQNLASEPPARETGAPRVSVSVTTEAETGRST